MRNKLGPTKHIDSASAVSISKKSFSSFTSDCVPIDLGDRVAQQVPPSSSFSRPRRLVSRREVEGGSTSRPAPVREDARGGRRRCHRGQRSQGSTVNRKVHRKKNKNYHRQQCRLWTAIFTQHDSTCKDTAESAWTDRFSNSFKHLIKNKEAVHNSTTGDHIKIAYWNIESLKRAGIQAELLSMMLRLNIMILFLSETKCHGEDSYRSGEFFIIKIGRPRREIYGVAVIIHRKLMKSVFSIRAVNHHMIYVQLKITGGLFTLFGVYAPHEGRPLDERNDFHNDLADCIANAARSGPLGVCGDLNCHLNYRLAGEEAALGPYLFCPTAPDPVYHGGPEPTNRDLLVPLCLTNNMCVANTFQPKSPIQQVTYFDRRAATWNATTVDPVYHKQLDIFIISQNFRGAVLDITSRRDVRVGNTNHHLQIVKMKMPLLRRPKRQLSPARLPWDIWKNIEAMNSLREALPSFFTSWVSVPTKKIQMLPDFDPIEDISKWPDPLLVYYDGSDTGRRAGWAFAVFEWSGTMLFERWGRVLIDPADPLSLGAASNSNNTGELSAFAEAMIWLICEMPYWRDRGVVFAYDSTYSVGAGTGEWRTHDSQSLIKTTKALWAVFDVDRFPIFGLKIKSHTQNPYNDYVDERAKWGAGVLPAFPCPQPRTISKDAALRRAESFVKLYSAQYADPSPPVELARVGADAAQASLVEAGHSIIEHLRAFVGPKVPRRPYISVHTLHLLAERDIAWQRDDKNHFLELERQIRKSVAKGKRDYIEEQVHLHNWKGVRMCKPYVARPLRVEDAEGRERPLQERAEVLSAYYATSQWHSSQLPPLPNRPPLFPTADLPCGDFSPDELKCARRSLKKKKSPGTDNLSNEVLLFVLNTVEGFAYILQLMNLCWATAVLPEEWQLARIVAIYKGKGAASLPANYRPSALLQATYKLFSILVEQRLRGLEGRVWKMQCGYRAGFSTDDANHLLLRAVELALRWQNLPLYILFLDWIKCFDRIHHDRLLDAVRRMGAPEHYIKVLRAIYSRLRFFVADSWGSSSTREQEQGVRQGDPLSCILLILLMTVIMLDAREGYAEECRAKGLCACRAEHLRIFGFEDVEYADDSNLLQSNLPCLRIFAKHYILEGKIYGLDANRDKSGLLVIARQAGLQNRIKHPDGWFYNVVDQSKTLGFTYGRGFDTAAALVTSKVGEMHGRMNEFKRVWTSQISLKNKVDKMQALVWSKGRWGLHLVHLNTALKRTLDGAQARYLRRLAKIPAAYISRVSNAKVRKKCYKTWRFSTQILQAQCHWLGHILRRPADHPLRLVVFEPGPQLLPRLSGTEYRRRRGRPRGDWAQTLIASLCNYTGRNRAQLLTLIQDKQKFHRCVARYCKKVDKE